MMTKNLSTLLINSLCLVFGCLSIAHNVSAAFAKEPPYLEVELESEELFVGESTTLQVAVHNADQPSPPSIKPLEELFDVSFLGEQSLNQSSTMIVNGRISQQNVFKHIYQYRITPKSSGTLTIPALTAKADGVEVRSKPSSIRVIEPTPQDDVLVEIVTDRNSIYPTQSFEITLRILIRSLPDSNEDPLKPLRRRPPHLSVPWIDSLEGLNGPDTKKWLSNLLSDRGHGFTINDINTSSGFMFDGPKSAVFDLLTGKEKRTNAEGETIEYFRYELTKKFQALRSGEFEFGPVLLKGVFVADRQFNPKKIGAIAKPILVNAKPVPSPRPDNFLGGIGNFAVNVDATPTRLRVGDPLTLTLDVSTLDTAASLEMVAAPDLSKVLAEENDFEVIDKNPVGRIEGNSKIFTYGVRPKSVGISVPELTFTTFDPKTESFVEIRSKPIPLEIVEAKTLQSSDIVGARSDKSSSIRADQSGIFQGTAETHPIRNEVPNLKLWSGIIGASWLTALGVVAFSRVRARSKKDEALQRRSKAKAIALTLLSDARKAMESGDHSQSRVLVRQSVCELFANALHLNPEGLTTQDILEQVTKLQLGHDHKQSLGELLHAIEAGQYGGGSAYDSEHLIQQAEELLSPLSVALLAAVRKGSKASAPTAVIALISFSFMSSISSASASFANAETDKKKQETHSILERSQTAKSPEEFAALATELESVRDAGLHGGAMYFHIGNAWFRAGQFGKAIYNYRFAKLYMPQDAYVSANLTQAIATAPGALKAQETPITDRILFWSSWISYPFKIQFFAFMLSISAFLFAMGVQLRNKKLVALSVLIAGLGTSVGLEGFLRSPDALASRYGVVVSETIARKGMGETSAPAFDKPLLDGAEFEVVQSTSQWTLGKFPGIGDGWVRNDAIITR
ncbi:MAG: BatD family protein [Pirellula sp.]|jgi:hypothetical protein|nr:BatD family protein [Pirellula sp.]